MIIRNSLINVVGVGVSLIIALLTTALLVRALDQAAFGLLVLVRTVVGNVGLLESLFGAGITRYVAFHNARGEFERRDTFLATGIAVNLVQGALISLVAIGLSSLFFERVFTGVPEDLVQRGPALLAVFFGVLIVQMVSLAFSRALEGIQAFPAVRGGDTFSQVLLLVLLYATVTAWPVRPLMPIAVAYLLSEAARALVFIVYARNVGIRIRFRMLDWTSFRALFSFGRPLMVAKFMTVMSFRGDALLLGLFTTLEVVATYQAANQIWSATVAAMSGLTTALMPLLAHRVAQGTSLNKVFLPASRYALSAAIVIATVVIYSRNFILTHWLSDRYLGAAPLILLFMVQLVITYHQGIGSLVALGSNKHQPIQLYEAVTAAVNLAVSLALIRTFGAQAVLIGGIVKCCLGAPLYTRLALRLLELRPKEYVRYVLTPAWRFGVLLGAAALLLRFGASGLHDTVFNFGGQIAMLLLVAAGLGWMLVLTETDRKRLLRAAW